jgi:hypothetical protein
MIHVYEGDLIKLEKDLGALIYSGSISLDENNVIKSKNTI